MVFARLDYDRSIMRDGYCILFEQMDKDGSGTISFEEFTSVLSRQENLSVGKFSGGGKCADGWLHVAC